MIDQEIINQFNALKFEHNVRALFLTLDDSNTDVILLGKAEKDTTHEDIISQLPTDDIRFVVLALDYTTDEKVSLTLQKIVFIQWIPTIAKLRRKLAAPTKSSELKQALTGFQLSLLAESMDDVSYDQIVQTLKKA